MLRHAAVSAEQAAIGVGADDGDGFELARGRAAADLSSFFSSVIDFVRGLQRQFAIRVAADDAIGSSGSTYGSSNRPSSNFQKSIGATSSSSCVLFEHVFLHQFDQVQIAVRVGQLDIDAGFHGERAGFFLVLGDEMAVRVGPIASSQIA